MEPQETRSELKCCRCNYVWVPRKQESPARCPSCRSIKWNQPHLKVSCKRCGHEWNSHDGSPIRCPGCGSSKWNQAPMQYICGKCGHNWVPKGGRPPRRCPECASRDWNRSRSKEVNDRADVYSNEQLDIIEVLSKAGRNPVQISAETHIPFSIVIDHLNGRAVVAKRR